MKSRIIYVFWGVALILIGGVLVAQTLGIFHLPFPARPFGVIAFGLASMLFFLSYFFSGLRKWGWLFPALFCSAVSLTMWMPNSDADDSFTAVSILASLAVPFYAGYALNRRLWGLLFPACTLTAIITAVLVEESGWGGAAFLLMLSLPFFVAYFRLQKNWWALLPAGILATLGLIALMETLHPSHENIPIGNMELGLYSGEMFLGFAIPFGILWLRRKTLPTGWAQYPAAGLLTASILILGRGKNFEHYWPVVLLVVGVMLLLPRLRREKPSIDGYPPVSKA